MRRYLIIAAALALATSASAAGIADQIDCSKFRKNPDGSWTGLAGATVAYATVAGQDLSPGGLSIQGEDVFVVLERKCLSK